MLVDIIKKQWKRQIKNKWLESYWIFDLHGTIIKPNRVKGNSDIKYYPYAKECLQILTNRSDIRTIIFTSSYPEELRNYNLKLKKDGINFKYFNENPEICEENGMFGYYESKPYFDIMFEDKAGFDPNKEWKLIYDLLISNDVFIPDIKWKNPRLP